VLDGRQGKKHVNLDGGINITTVQIRVRFLLLYFLMTDSIESVTQYVIEFHTAAASFFPICFVFPIQFFITINFAAGHVRWRDLHFPTNLRD